MALNYLSGRVSRFAVGVPGFSTATDLTLAVSGAIGVETFRPLCEIDTPNISIRSQILDSSAEAGPLGYFLSADVNGIRWVAAEPGDLTFIRLYDNGQQPGFSSVSGLNFVTSDEQFISISTNTFGDPNIADINFDVRWSRQDYGSNKGISTGFGTDGTYASIPGFGTSEAVGVTSVGIGTNMPQDDFQVGIGSTGVTINGPQGKVEAEIIKAKNIEVDGNLTVESLVVTPGIATLTDLEVVNTAKIPTEYVGFSSIREAQIDFLFAGTVLAGLTTLGFGGEDVFILNDLYVQGGLGTFDGDVFVGGDLTVQGDVFFRQINAENIIVSGVSTLNQVEAQGIAVTDFAVSGFSTLSDLSFFAGVGTDLAVDTFRGGIGTFGSIDSGDAVIGIATVDVISSEEITVGFLSATDVVAAGGTIGGLEAEGDLVRIVDLFVTGLSTFVGVGTFESDLYVGEDLFVRGDVTFKNINAEQLLISGVGTIRDLKANTGVVTTFITENLQNTVGVSTLRQIESQQIDVGDLTADDAFSLRFEAEEARIGILTGDLINYGIGTITTLESVSGLVSSLRGSTLNYTDFSFINGVQFGDQLVTMGRDLFVTGITTFVGVGTFGDDLYVRNDLFVGGTLNFRQLTGENLLITGIGTFNDIRINTGFATYVDFETLEAGIATITNIDSTFIDTKVLDTENMVVSGLATVNQQLSEFLNANNLGFNTAIGNEARMNTLDVFVSANIKDLTFETGLGTFLKTVDQEVVGVATVNELDVDKIDVEQARIGDLLVTGVTTYQSIVNIEDVVFTNQEVTGISTVNQLFFNVGLGTELEVRDLEVTGVATVGLLSATDAEITNLEVFDSKVAQEEVGIVTIGTGSSETSSFFRTGIGTIVGFTTITGDVFIDGNLDVSRSTTFKQLNADQSVIGILTVTDILDSRKVSNLNQVSIAGSFTATGVSTIGLSTFKNGDLNINRNLTVGGIVTFQNTVNIDKVEFVELNVTGISSIAKLYVNSGLATQFGVDNFGAQVGFITDLNVTGLSTFVGLASFQDAVFENITVNGLATLNDSVQTGIATIADARIAKEEVGFSSVKEQLVGISTITQLFIQDSVTSSGVATFIGDVEIQSDLDVAGATRLDRLQVAGISTLNVANIVTADIDVLTAQDASIGTSRIGFSSITFLETNDLKVVGPSTFSGDMFIDGDLFVTGVATYGQLNAEQSIIGILTVTKYLDTQDLIVSGITTFEQDIDINADINIEADILMTGIVTATSFDIIFGRVGVQTVGNQRVVGIATFESDIEVQGNADINTATIGVATVGVATIGIATINELETFDLTVTGLSTFSEDAYFSEDVFVEGNLFVAGVTTFAQLNADQSIIGILTVTNKLNPNDIYQTPAGIASLTTVRVNTGIATRLEVEDGYIGFATVGLATVTNLEVSESLVVTGISTLGTLDPLTGFTTVVSDLYIGGNLYVKDDIFKDEISGRNAYITGVGTINTLRSNVGIITTLYAERAEIETGIVTSLRAEFAEVGNFISTAGFITNLRVSGVSTFVGVATFQEDTFFDKSASINDNLRVGGAIRAEDIVVNNNIRADSGIITSLTVQTSVAGTSTVLNDLSVGKNVSSLSVQTGILTAGVLDVGIATVGFASATNAFIGNLTFEDANGDYAFIDDVFIGVATITQSNLAFTEVGIATISTEYVGVSSIGFATITNAFIKDFTFEEAIGDYVSANESFSGISTVVFADISSAEVGILTVSSSTVAISSIGFATVTSAFIKDFTFETAVGDYVFSDEAQIGVATATKLNASDAVIGVATVSQLNFNDITAQFALRLTSSSTLPQAIFSTNELEFRSFDINIQAVGGPNVHSTRIHAAHDGSTAIFNEYSTIFNNIELGDYSVNLAGGVLSLDVVPVSAGIITYTATISAMKA